MSDRQGMRGWKHGKWAALSVLSWVPNEHQNDPGGSWESEVKSELWGDIPRPSGEECSTPAYHVKKLSLGYPSSLPPPEENRAK